LKVFLFFYYALQNHETFPGISGKKIFMNSFLLSEEIPSAFPNFLEIFHGFCDSVAPLPLPPLCIAPTLKQYTVYSI
jgi:hypothetical protein